MSEFTFAPAAVSAMDEHATVGHSIAHRAASASPFCGLPTEEDIILIQNLRCPMSPTQKTPNVVSVGLRLRGHPVYESVLRFGACSIP